MDSVHIFGVNHFLQWVDPMCLYAAGRADEAEQKGGLRSALDEVITANQVELIAEEEKPEHRNLGAAIAEERHLNCVALTIPIAEREQLGTDTRTYQLRPETKAHAYGEFERRMFQQIVSKNARVTLAICGRRHMWGLEQRVQNAGVTAIIYDVYDYDWYRGIPLEDLGDRSVIGYERDMSR